MAFFLLEHIGVTNAVATVTICLLVIWFLRANFRTLPCKLPPGPPAIPTLLGGLLALLPKKDMVGQLQMLHKRYGDILYVRNGRERIVFLGSAGAVKEVLRDQEKLTSHRQIPVLFELCMAHTGGLIWKNGKSWQDIRRFSIQALRKFGMGRKSSEQIIQEESRLFCQAIGKLSGEAFDFPRLVNATTFNVIGTLVLGKRRDYDDPTTRDVIERLYNLSRDMNMNPVVKELVLNFPIFLRSPLVRRVMNNIVGIKDFIVQEVREHCATFDPSDMRDVLDTFIMEARRLVESGEDPYISQDEIWMVLFDLFLAGTETSSTAMSWFTLFMAGHLDIQQKVVEEIDHVIGRERAPSSQDLKHMPYMEATLMEVLRHRPVSPIFRANEFEDVHLRGYTIPKGTMIIGNTQAAHHDPEKWDDPEVFNPHRFLSEDKKTLIKPDAFVAFGTGRRACLGEHLARTELFTYATMLLQRFSLRLPEGDTADTSVDHCHFLAMYPKRFKLIAAER